MLKQHILAEIQRTAVANGGLPLGRQRFADETGIRETDWSGKHWARWGDAILEAGLSPNKLQIAFTDEHLLQHYSTLVLARGGVPTAPELRLHARQTPDFPSHNTFARFGNRSQLLATLYKFASTRAEFEAVAKHLASYALAGTVEPEAPAGEVEEPYGFVYLIKSGGHYKLGRTNALGRRERELAIQLPERAVTVHSIRTDDPHGIESYWHRRFEEKRKNGEWFELNARDVAAFRRRKFM